jgi:hypothetical protein
LAGFQEMFCQQVAHVHLIAPYAHIYRYFLQEHFNGGYSDIFSTNGWPAVFFDLQAPETGQFC